MDKVSRRVGEKDGGDGPLRIDSRPSRWSVTREAERTGEKVGRTDILSVSFSVTLRIGLPRIPRQRGQECWQERERTRERKGGESKRGREEEVA